MKKFKFTSLTMRIWTILTLVILGIVLTISLLYLLVFSNAVEEREREFLYSSHQYILQLASNGVIDDTNNPFSKSEGLNHFVFNENQKSVRFIRESDTNHEPSLTLWMSSFIGNHTNTKYHESFKEKYQNQTYLFEISYVDEKEYLISYMPSSHTEHFLEMIFIGLIITLIGFFVSKVIATNIAKPLEQLESYTKKIANKEWNTYNLDIQSNDEIGRLASAMNEMKQALKQADEEERKFLQSISHDLKTPVMVIMSYAQALIDGMYVESPEYSATIIKNEAERLEKKIKQILYLNTLDYVLEHNQEEADEIYLDKIVNYLVHNFQQVNSDLEWKLDLEVESAVVTGNSDQIRVSIENILENQLRYASNTIQLSLKEDDTNWIIEISNDGPLFEEQDLQQVFNNFGLGLAISKRIINHYQGEIYVENKDDQHVCFTIYYPKTEDKRSLE